MRDLVNSSHTSQPRERLINLGVQALSDVELLSLILYSGGKANNVLNLSLSILKGLNSTQELTQIGYFQLLEVKGLGKAKSCAILASVELGKRIYLMHSVSDKKPLTNPKEVFKFMRSYTYGLEKENVYVLSLNSKGFCLRVDHVSKGTVDSSIAHPRDILEFPIKAKAQSLILVHNHPSGDVYPSEEDIEISHVINDAAASIGISMLDHLIVSDENYFSIKSLNIF